MGSPSLPPGPRTPAPWNMLQFTRRPIETLRGWHARYGNVFTVRYSGFGTGVYVVDPESIKQLFTGDQSDLRAGEANSFMEPVLGITLAPRHGPAGARLDRGPAPVDQPTAPPGRPGGRLAGPDVAVS